MASTKWWAWPMVDRTAAQPHSWAIELSTRSAVSCARQQHCEVVIVNQRPAPNTLPPGQRPVPRGRDVHIGLKPQFDPDTWDLMITGLVAQPMRLRWHEFVALPAVQVAADLHCVEGWSVVGLTWEGPRLRDVIDKAAPQPEARYAYFICGDGYATSLPIEVAMAEDVILARLRNGEPIPADEGGPIQLIVPNRYGYKWARWVRGIALLARDYLGYWEQRGYSNTADVWKNDRLASRR